MENVPGVMVLTWEETRAFVDRESRRVLGAGVDEAIARADAGQLDLSDPETFSLWMLIDVAR
jgi:hypothetical protein